MGAEAVTGLIDEGTCRPCGDGRVHIDRFGRRAFARLLTALGYRIGVEVGTERGTFAKMLLSRNLDLRLYCVDPWKLYPGYRDHVTQEHIDAIRADAFERLAPYDVTFIEEFSPAAAVRFADDSVDFVYLDANHEYGHVRRDLRAWVPKVRQGGVVAGHDYLGGVEAAVEAYTAEYDVGTLYTFGPVGTQPGETVPSWFWMVE